MNSLAGVTPGEVTAIVAVSLVFLHVAGRMRGRLFASLGACALLGHLFIAIVVLPRLPYQWDIAKFHGHALTILQGGALGGSSTVNSFAAFQSLIYATFGADPTVVAIVNGLLAVLVAVPIADVARRLYPTLDSTNGVVAAVLFLPLSFLFLSIPMRDALNVAMFFTLIALLVRGYDTGRTELWLPAVPLFGMLSLLRTELAVISLAGIGVAILVHVSTTVSLERISVRTFVASAIPAGLASLLAVGPYLPVDRVAEMVNFRARGGAAYLASATYDTWIELVLAAPVRAVYFQFAPFPLHVTSAFDLLAATMTPVLIVLTVAAYRSARDYRRDNVILLGLATTYVLGVVGYGLVDSNFGTTVRHRIPFTFLLVVFAAPVFERWEQSLREWIGQRPRDDYGQNEQQREAEELHGGVRVRAEDAD